MSRSVALATTSGLDDRFIYKNYVSRDQDVLAGMEVIMRGGSRGLGRRGIRRMCLDGCEGDILRLRVGGLGIVHGFARCLGV